MSDEPINMDGKLSGNLLIWVFEQVHHARRVVAFHEQAGGIGGRLEPFTQKGYERCVALLVTYRLGGPQAVLLFCVEQGIKPDAYPFKPFNVGDR